MNNAKYQSNLYYEEKSCKNNLNDTIPELSVRSITKLSSYTCTNKGDDNNGITFG